jgi:Cu/Ag efflux protein CusF
MKTILAILAALTVATAVAQAPMTDAVVRTVDKPAGKITLKHGEIANLGMMPMTMVFEVNDPAMLQKVKPGDNVRFTAEKRGGAYVVTKIEPAAAK